VLYGDTDGLFDAYTPGSWMRSGSTARRCARSSTITRPPHRTSPPRIVSYVITDRGAEPVERVEGKLNHEHYLQRQLRPIAAPVLELLGLDFDRVIGDDAQLSLF
jgi:DNA polymerase elongation subunit (family B)